MPLSPLHRARSVFPWLLALLWAGCVLSFEPAISDETAMFDPRLIGEWEEATGERASVAGTAAGGYQITYTDDKGRTGLFDARLGHLGDRLVLEVFPADGQTDPLSGLLVPGHLLFFPEFAEDEVHLQWFDADSVHDALRSGSAPLPYHAVDERMLLGGDTDGLRALLTSLIDRRGFVVHAGSWRRADHGPRLEEPPCFEVSNWREADQLFHRDPHWLGSDGASTVDLDPERTLWLFGDTWIDPSGSGSRSAGHMVSNSVAVQTGLDPATASIAFYWGHTDHGRPSAFFPDRDGERLWFGNGIRVDDRLVLFLGRIRPVNRGLGFESAGWTAFLIENPDDEPSRWRRRELPIKANPLGVMIGFGAVVRLDNYVYAFGSQDPVKSHPVYLVRWPAQSVREGDLSAPEWWAGESVGWVDDPSDTPRWPVFENGQSELSVHQDPHGGGFIAVHSVGFGRADLALRAAPALTGPWTDSRVIYRPPEYYVPDIMIYAAKAHPRLQGADLIVTYATNSFTFADHIADALRYYPRFVRLNRCR